MDAYDIFKKLTKGLTFPKKVLGIKNSDFASKLVPVKKEKEKVEIKKEDVESDIEVLSDNSGSVKSETNSDEQQSEDDLQLMEGVKVGEKKKKKKKEKSEDLQKKLELEEQNRFRNEHGIKTVGRHVPAALQDFSDLVNRYNVSQALIDVVKQCGYDEPTPVQRQAIPCMLEDRQILACAPTGSGKTAAFLVPILHALGAPQGGPRALILCPTRELAHQIYREVLRLSASTELRCSVVRNLKESKVKEREATIRKSDIVISTPNRLCYLLNQDNVNISLDKVSWLIIDEADKLFEGSAEQAADFRQQLEQVVGACGARRRRVAMFSATHTPAVGKRARRLRGLINVTVGQRNAASSLVQQELQYCGSEGGKLLAFRQLLRAGLEPPVLVFVQSKERAKQLFKELIYDGINVDVIHADRTQQQRDNVVRSFRVGRVWVLICTELMARGVDFRGVRLVLNYDFPPSAIAYVHRVGRAGRAGHKGKAITFFTQDDIGNLRSIASVLVQSGCEVPEYMLKLKPDRSRRRRAARPPRRAALGSAPKRPDKRKLEQGKAALTDTTKVTPLVKNGKNKKHRKLQNGEQKPNQNIKQGNRQKGGDTNANHKLGGKDKTMKKKNKKKMAHEKVKNNT